MSGAKARIVFYLYRGAEGLLFHGNVELRSTGTAAGGCPHMMLTDH